MYERAFSSLRVAGLTPEAHATTCGYWYTVTNGATAHTAFATILGLGRWLDERNLKLDGSLPAQGRFASIKIIGEYRECSHMDEREFYALRPVLATATLSNGSYTLALITEDEGGVRTVHNLNPNVRTRVVFDHRPTRRLMDGGAIDPVRTDQSKYADHRGTLRYSADHSEVYPGPTGVRRGPDSH